MSRLAFTALVAIAVAARASSAPGQTPPRAATRHARPALAPAPEGSATVHAAPPVEAHDLDRETLRRDEIRTAPGTGGDALRAIQNLPGVARAPTLQGDLIVRGSSPADTQVFVDGTPLPLLYHYLGLTSTIATEMLERIDFLPSNQSARFGRGVGGVVDVALRAPRRDRFHVVATLDVINGGALIEGPLGPNASFAFGGRYGWAGHVLALAHDVVPNVIPAVTGEFGDYQGVLEWRPHARTRVRLAVFGSGDTLSALEYGAYGPPIRADLHFHLVQLRVEHDAGHGVRLRGVLAAGWSLAQGNPTGFDVRVESVPISGRYELSLPIGPRARVTLGADVELGPVSATLSVPASALSPAFAHAFAAVAYQPGLFAEAELHPTSTLTVTPAIRFDYTRSNREVDLQPRVTARWGFARVLAMRAGVGLYTQAPRFDANSVLPVEALLPSFPGLHLPSQRAMHYALGLELALPPFLTVSLEGFYKSIDDVLRVDTSRAIAFVLSIPGNAITATASGRAYGLELLARFRWRGLHGFVAYSLSHAEQRDAPGGAWYPFAYDQPHALTALASWDLGAGWEVGARFRYVSGHPYTGYALGVYDATTLQYIGVPGATNALRVPDFQQLDVRVEKRFQVARGSLSIYLEVLNVYNRTNTENSYALADLRGTAYAPSLPLIPNLGLRGEY